MLLPHGLHTQWTIVRSVAQLGTRPPWDPRALVHLLAGSCGCGLRHPMNTHPLHSITISQTRLPIPGALLFHCPRPRATPHFCGGAVDTLVRERPSGEDSWNQRGARERGCGERKVRLRPKGTGFWPGCLPLVQVLHRLYPAYLPELRNTVVAGTPPGLLTLRIEAIRSLADPLFACPSPYTLARALAVPQFVRLLLTCPNNLTRTTTLDRGGCSSTPGSDKPGHACRCSVVERVRGKGGGEVAMRSWQEDI